MEPSGASHIVAQALIAAGIPTEISANVRNALWAKLVINCAYNALSAITQLPYGRLIQGDGVRAALADIVAECKAVAAADGVTLPADLEDSVSLIAKTMAHQSSSTAQDLARGKRSEIDYLNGMIVGRGQALGIATPANHLLHTLVRLLEDKTAAGVTGDLLP
jgi:2-dehydropantoate 2-reductase